MASGLESYINHTVSIITSDGRHFVTTVNRLISAGNYDEPSEKTGTLRGFDQTINIILDETHERVYSPNQGIEQVVLGLHIIRGDNVAVVGEMDDEMDSRLDMNSIRAEPLGSVVH